MLVTTTKSGKVYGFWTVNFSFTKAEISLVIPNYDLSKLYASIERTNDGRFSVRFSEIGTTAVLGRKMYKVSRKKGNNGGKFSVSGRKLGLMVKGKYWEEIPLNFSKATLYYTFELPGIERSRQRKPYKESPVSQNNPSTTTKSMESQKSDMEIAMEIAREIKKNIAYLQQLGYSVRSYKLNKEDKYISGIEFVI